MPHWVPGMSAVQTQITAGVDFWQPFGHGHHLRRGADQHPWCRCSERHPRAQGGPRPTPRPWATTPDVCKHPDCQQPSQHPRLLRQAHQSRRLPCVGVPHGPVLSRGQPIPSSWPRPCSRSLVSTEHAALHPAHRLRLRPASCPSCRRVWTGLIGQNIQIPHLHEATVFLTGFRGVEIWFVPLSGADFGGGAETFRIIELCGHALYEPVEGRAGHGAHSPGGQSALLELSVEAGSHPLGGLSLRPDLLAGTRFRRRRSNTRRPNTVSCTEAGEEVEGRDRARGSSVVPGARPICRTGSLYYWRVRVTDDLVDDETGLEVRNPDLRTLWPLVRERATSTPTSRTGADSTRPVPQSGPGRYVRHPGEAGPTRTSPAAFLRAVSGQRRRGRGQGGVHAARVAFRRSGTTERWSDHLRARYGSQLPRRFFPGLRRDSPCSSRSTMKDLRVRRVTVGTTTSTAAWTRRYWNQKDDDGDGVVDEDTGHHPHAGQEVAHPGRSAPGLRAVLLHDPRASSACPYSSSGAYIRSRGLGRAWPTFFTLFTEIIGALHGQILFLAALRQARSGGSYAMVLAVGFGVGMSLVGMFCAATLMIAKAVSATAF